MWVKLQYFHPNFHPEPGSILLVSSVLFVVSYSLISSTVVVETNCTANDTLHKPFDQDVLPVMR